MWVLSGPSQKGLFITNSSLQWTSSLTIHVHHSYWPYLILPAPTSSLYLLPWRWRQHVPPKHWCALTTLHNVTANKAMIWINVLLFADGILSYANLCVLYSGLYCTCDICDKHTQLGHCAPVILTGSSYGRLFTHLSPCGYVGILPTRPPISARDFELLHSNQGKQVKNGEQSLLCFDSFKLQQATLQVPLHLNDICGGKNGILVHSGSSLSSEKIGAVKQ